ncbi:MAG: hypothetical protein EA398_17915 [Deltaproteobacteria bacterium]|nr:MAG: hypothetical protein EA398_17915 [Deltaproteobacteria bacterium]
MATPPPETPPPLPDEAPEATTSVLVQVLGTLGVLLFIAVIPLGAASMPWIVSKARGYHDVVLEPLQTCQVALNALGENPRFTPFGNNSGGRQSGLISWSATVRGSEARGTYRYSLRGSRDAWELVSATLIVDGHVHRLMHCARADGR